MGTFPLLLGILLASLSFVPAVWCLNCSSVTTSISSIQGSGNISPLVNSIVQVKGIVTADLQQGFGSTNGFFLQEIGSGDDDPSTSDGIFVYEASKSVSQGDIVVLSGKVVEFNNLTEISTVTDVIVCSSNEYLPKPVVLDIIPTRTSAQIYLERYEGMLVSLPNATVVEVYSLGRYSEVKLSSQGRIMTSTQISAPGVESISLLQEYRDSLLIDDGSSTQYPVPVRFPTNGLNYTNTLRVGDSVYNATGPLTYTFSTFRIFVAPSAMISSPSFRPSNPRAMAPPATQGRITVASFNVLNYFNGPFPTTRGAANAQDFAKQRKKIVSALTIMDAAVVGLMEMENDGYGPDSAIQDLVNGLNEATIVGKYRFVHPGREQVGTDEIAVKIIYQPDRASPVGAAAILNETFDANFVTTLNRPSLAQSFRDALSGTVFTVVVNHLKSKGSACAGDPDLGNGAGNCNLVRKRAAAALGRWVWSDPTGSGSPHFIIIGDLNAYAKEDPIVELVDRWNLTDLVARHVGLSKAYSYVFQGQSGYLDHALASPSLAARTTDLAEWHINADEPAVLGYETESAAQGDMTGDGPFRSSDHDPTIVGLDLGAGGATLEIAHINDHHSNLDPTTLDLVLGGAVTRSPVGGYPAVVAMLQALPPGTLKIHAGDAMTGTLYHTLYKGRADAAAMGEACFDTFTLGNHEFDEGDAVLRDFLDALRTGPCPRTRVLSANVRPAVGTPLAPVSSGDYIARWTNVSVNGSMVAVVAGLTVRNKTMQSSSPLASTVFLEETAAAQAAIDEALAAGFNKVVLATHIGYKADLNLAKALRGVDVIIGGDSHSLLGNGAGVGLTTEGPYPSMARNADGRLVCIGQAWEYAKAMGRMSVHFDSAGHVVSCSGRVTLPIPKNSQILSNIVGTPEVTKFSVQVPPNFRIPYSGNNSAAKLDFAEGFYPGYGSGLAFKGKVGNDLYFYALTDRGPNGDGPKNANATGLDVYGGKPLVTISKVFSSPAFAPSIGTIKVNASGAFLESSMPILRSPGGLPISGRPPLPNVSLVLPRAYGFLLGGASGEVPLNDAFGQSTHDPDGLDPEALVLDPARGVFWVSDEYGPFIVKVDMVTGGILKKYYPGYGLPPVLAHRRANRGIEGMCLDPDTGNLHGFLQSPIDPLDSVGNSITQNPSNTRIRDKAKFLRWFEFNPNTETSKLYALPIDGSLFKSSRTGEAKLGDLICLGRSRFVTIFQGAARASPNDVFNWLSMIRIPPGVTDIANMDHNLEASSWAGAIINGMDYSKVVGIEITKMLDLNALGWKQEKCEGLAMVDDRTIAVGNDNDFGLKSVLTNADGSVWTESPNNVEDHCAVSVKTTAGSFYSCAGCCNDPCGCGAGTPRVTTQENLTSTNSLWIVRFARPLNEWTTPVSFMRAQPGTSTFSAVDPATSLAIETALAADTGYSIQAKVVEVKQSTLRTIQNYSDPMAAMRKTVIGRANSTLCLVRIPGTRTSLNPNTDACFNQTRLQGSAVTQLVAESYLVTSRRAQMVLQNAGGVRTGILQGDVSIDSAYTVLPFSNTLVELEMTGREIDAALEDAANFVASASSNTGAFPYAAGLRWCYNASAPSGARFSSLQVRVGPPGSPESAWKELEMDRVYVVVANDFIASGKDGYTTLKKVSDSGRAFNTFTYYTQPLIDYIRRLGTVAPLAPSDYSSRHPASCAAAPSPAGGESCRLECCTRAVNLAMPRRSLDVLEDVTVESVEVCVVPGWSGEGSVTVHTGRSALLSAACAPAGPRQMHDDVGKAVVPLLCRGMGSWMALDTAAYPWAGASRMRLCWRKGRSSGPWNASLVFNYDPACQI